MIEAVNSVVSNAQALRANVEAIDAARSLAANPGRVQEAAEPVLAPYVSPYIHVDVNYNKAVLQIRNRDTGDVLKQYPSESAMQARLRVEASVRQAAEFIATAGQSGGGDSNFVAPEVSAAPAPAAPAPRAPVVAEAQVAAATLSSAATATTPPPATTTSVAA